MNPLERRIGRLLLDEVLIDTHNDLMSGIRRWCGYDVSGFDGLRPEFHTDLPRLKRGGVRAQVWSVFSSASQTEAEATVSTLEQIDALYRFAAAHPHDLAVVTSVAEAETAIAGGRIASFIGIEGGHSVAASLGVLRMFARLGVRTMTLTHNTSLAWADAATDEPRAGGLSADGRAIIRELNRSGVVADLSHTSVATQLQTLDVTTKPVLFTHSSVYSVCDHPRNVTDDVLAKLAVNGGVVQITFVAQFVSKDFWNWTMEAEAARASAGLTTALPWPGAPAAAESAAHTRARNLRMMPAPDEGASHRFEQWVAAHPPPPVTVAQVADHVEASRDLAGVDHIGLGGDFDGVPDLPAGLDDVSGYPRLFEELAARGWNDDELARLAGRNTLRVLRDNEGPASTGPAE